MIPALEKVGVDSPESELLLDSGSALKTDCLREGVFLDSSDP